MSLKSDAAAVRKILHGTWDPIGCGVPEDEYDDYLWPVLDLLKRGAPAEEVRDYLRMCADESMQSPVPEERLELTVEMLMGLGLKM